MKWLSNISNPKDPNAKLYVHPSLYETQEEAWNRHVEWLKDKIIGRPKATTTYTVEELENMGLVGVYENPILSGQDAVDYINSLRNCTT